MDAKREAWRIPNTYGFDRAVGRRRLDQNAFAWLVDRLAMKRVDVDFICTTQYVLQDSAFSEGDGVSKLVETLDNRFALVRAVIHPAGNLMHMLMKRTAKRHVKLLNAAANGEYGHSAFDGAAQERKCCCITCRIALAVPACLSPFIVNGIDVRRATGDQEAVERVQPLIQRKAIEPIADRRQSHRKPACAVDYAFYIALADLVDRETMRAKNSTGGNTDYREMRLH